MLSTILAKVNRIEQLLSPNIETCRTARFWIQKESAC